MGVKGGFYIECGGPDCRPDRQGRKRTLGRIEMDDDGQAFWFLGWGRRFRISVGPEGLAVTPGEGKMIWHVEPGADKARWQVESGDDDYRVTCDRCRAVWVFTVDELTARYDELARRQPPVGVAGVDVGSPVGGVGRGSVVR